MNERRILFHRNLPLAVDVADAIEKIIARDTDGTPLALTIEQIAIELVRISTLDDEGDAVVLPAAARNAVLEKFANHLATSSTFKAGYKQYEERSHHQVVPVTTFFFKVVYTDEARECLDAMTNYEVGKSLPARPGRLTDEHGNPLEGDFEENGPGSTGRTAGIVIFPTDYRALIDGHKQGPKLVGAWLRRGANIALGVTDKVVERLENAASTSARLAKLKETVHVTRRDMVAALPKPKN